MIRRIKGEIPHLQLLSLSSLAFFHFCQLLVEVEGQRESVVGLTPFRVSPLQRLLQSVCHLFRINWDQNKLQEGSLGLMVEAL